VRATVGPALLWLDARAGRIADELRRGPGDPARFAATAPASPPASRGRNCCGCNATGRLPAAAATAFHCKDWLTCA
jgi:erythritol kinase